VVVEAGPSVEEVVRLVELEVPLVVGASFLEEVVVIP